MTLLSLINNTQDSRIVNVASIAHRYGKLKPSTFLYEEHKKYRKTLAYFQSKLANLLFTYGLKSRLENSKSLIKVLAAHPGITRTNLGNHIKPLRVRPITRIMHIFNQKTPQGALPSIRACTDINVKSGDYYGPDGLFAVRGYPVLEKSTKRSHLKQQQDILWDYSVKITNLDINL